MNILSQKIAAIEKHISTHSERSVEDITLQLFCVNKPTEMAPTLSFIQSNSM